MPKRSARKRRTAQRAVGEAKRTSRFSKIPASCLSFGRHALFSLAFSPILKDWSRAMHGTQVLQLKRESLNPSHSGKNLPIRPFHLPSRQSCLYWIQTDKTDALVAVCANLADSRVVGQLWTLEGIII
jgi:hypothetical protein